MQDLLWIAVMGGLLALTLAYVTRGGEEIHLTRKEFEVLRQIALSPGRVVTHQRIFEGGWPYEHDRRAATISGLSCGTCGRSSSQIRLTRRSS